MKRFVGIVVMLILLAGAAMFPVGSPQGGETITVRSGDTLGKLASRHGVSVTQLRQWNTVDGDLIQVGQELQIDEGGTTRPLWQVVRELAQQDGVELATLPKPARRGTPSKSAARPGTRAPSLPDGVYPTDDGGFVNDDGMYVNRRGQPIDENGDVLGGEPTPQWDSLSRPAPKQCLDAMTGIGEGGDNAFGRSEGLSASQVSGAVARFQKQTLRCADGHDDISGQVSLELVIGCDGRVKSVTVLGDGVRSGDFAACVADVMRYAPFPAHARDEVTVQIPLTFD